MGSIMNVGLTGLVTQNDVIGAVADNLANVDTVGFGSRVTTVAEQGGVVVRPANTTLMGQVLTPASYQPLGTALQSDTPVFSDGIEPTGQPLDVAVNGNGFFAVQTANGGVAYTRSGSFHVDAAGNLVTAEGNFILPRIRIPAGAQPTIDSSGQVTVEVNGSPQVVGQIQLANIPNPGSLLDLGNGLYAPSRDTGPITVGAPGQGGLGTLVPGSLNESGVSVAGNFVTMIQAQAAYTLSAKLISVAAALDQATSQLG